MELTVTIWCTDMAFHTVEMRMEKAKAANGALEGPCNFEKYVLA